LSVHRSIAAVVPAAGLSRRFGADKLLAELSGRPLAAHIADTLAGMGLGHLIAVCPRGNPARARLFAERGFEIVWNDAPQRGLGHSVALGAARAQALGAMAVLVCLADMPNVTREHIEGLLAAENEGETLATEVDGIRMPPALFPHSALLHLVALTGEEGAKALLAQARTIRGDATLVRDIDTRADLPPGTD
jgi:molybdenum cofactor cytidylyltransferase